MHKPSRFHFQPPCVWTSFDGKTLNAGLKSPSAERTYNVFCFQQIHSYTTLPTLALYDHLPTETVLTLKVQTCPYKWTNEALYISAKICQHLVHWHQKPQHLAGGKQFQNQFTKNAENVTKHIHESPSKVFRTWLLLLVCCDLHFPSLVGVEVFECRGHKWLRNTHIFKCCSCKYLAWGNRLEEIVERMWWSSKDVICQPTDCLQEKAAREWAGSRPVILVSELFLT